MLVPQIETERLRLRTYRADELETVYRVCSDADVRRFFHPDYAITRADVLTSLPRRLKRWKSCGFGQLGVFDKLDDRLIGFCGLQFLDKAEDVEIYYGFLKEFWGKGIATEAACAVLRFGFESVKLERIVAAAHHENYASHRVLEKIGMTKQPDEHEFYGVKAAFFVLSADDFTIDFPIYALKYEECDEPNDDV